MVEIFRKIDRPCMTVFFNLTPALVGLFGILRYCLSPEEGSTMGVAGFSPVSSHSERRQGILVHDTEEADRMAGLQERAVE